MASKSEAAGTASHEITLEEMKAAAAEVGFDPALVERAARLVTARASSTLLERVIGGPVRHRRELRFPIELSDRAAESLLSAVRAKMGEAGRGTASPVGMSWHSGAEGDALHVAAHSEPGVTRVAIDVDRRSALVLTSIGATVGFIATVTLAGVVGDPAPLLGWAVGVTGTGGVLALARGFWASSTRKVRERLDDLTETIDQSLTLRLESAPTPDRGDGSRPMADQSSVPGDAS